MSESCAANGRDGVEMRDEVSPAPRMEGTEQRYEDEGPGSPAPRMEGTVVWMRGMR